MLPMTVIIHTFLMLFLPICAASALLIACNFSKKKKGKHNKKKKGHKGGKKRKEGEDPSTPKTAVEGTEDEEDKKKDKTGAANSRVHHQLPPGPDFPILPKDKSTIVCTFTGSTMTNTTSQQHHVPKTLESRSSHTLSKEDKQAQSPVKTMVRMGTVNPPEDPVFTEVSGEGHTEGDTEETQRQSMDEKPTDDNMKTAHKVAAAPIAAAPESPVPADPTKKTPTDLTKKTPTDPTKTAALDISFSSSTELTQLTEATTATSVPSTRRAHGSCRPKQPQAVLVSHLVTGPPGAGLKKQLEPTTAHSIRVG